MVISALFHAVVIGHLEIAQGTTALHIAAGEDDAGGGKPPEFSGSIKTIQHLLDRGIPVDIQDYAGSSKGPLELDHWYSMPYSEWGRCERYVSIEQSENSSLLRSKPLA